MYESTLMQFLRLKLLASLHNINLFPHNHLIYSSMANIKTSMKSSTRDINVCTLVSKLDAFI